MPSNVSAHVEDPYASWTLLDLDAALADVSVGRMADSRGAFEYSNFGYAVVGAAVSALAGRPFEDVARSDLFAPLGMTATAVPDASDTIDDARDWGFGIDGRRAKPWRFDAMAPAGGVRSTLDDLSVFPTSDRRAVDARRRDLPDGRPR